MDVAVLHRGGGRRPARRVRDSRPDPIAEQNARRRAESGDRHAAINEAVGAALDRLEASGVTATKEATFEESGIEGMTPSQFGKLFEARNAWFAYRTERVAGSRQSRVVRKA